MRNVSTRAIILKKRNIGENDQFITFFSATLGTIEALAKGSRKIASSSIGHLELLNICQIQLYKTSHRYTLTQCQAEKTFKALRDDLNRSMNALLILEIFQKSVHGCDRGEELLSLVEETLTNLATGEKSLFLIENFKVKLLQLSGSLPDISHCSECHRKWSVDEKIFISTDSHILCQNCTTTNTDSTVDYGIMKLVNYLSGAPLEKSKKIRLTPEQLNALHKLTSTFLEHSLTAEIHTEKIRSQLIR